MKRTVVFLALVVGCGDGPLEPPPPLALECGETMNLSVGQSADLGKGDTLCVALAPGGYAVAYFDDRLVEMARTGPELPEPAPTIFSVSVQDLDRAPAFDAALRRTEGSPGRWESPDEPSPDLSGGSSGGSERDRGEHMATTRGLVGDASGAECGYWDPLFCRTEVLGLGDPLAFRLQPNAEPIPVEVKLVVGEFVVVERPTGNVANAFSERLQEAVDLAEEYTIPLLRVGYRDRRVQTTPAGQTVIFVEERGGLSTIFGSFNPEGAFRGGVVLRITALPSESETTPLLHLFSHELAHVWQWAFLFDDGGDTPFFVPTWGAEGGACLMAQEALRLLLGLSLDDVLGDEPGDRPGEESLWRSVTSARGELVAGYAHAAGFMRYMLDQSLLSGGTYETALSAIAKGGLEGWFGAVPPNGLNPGLALRMGPLLGTDFDPTRAVLDWAVSAGVDDRYPDARFRIPLLLESWRRGWAPDGTVSAGGRCCVSANLTVGNAGYAIVDVMTEARVRLATGLPIGIRWRVARYR